MKAKKYMNMKFSAEKIYYNFSQENSQITNMYNNIEYHDSVTQYTYVGYVG